MTRRRLLAESESIDIAEYMAYESIVGPIGHERADYRAALGAWASLSPHQKKGAEPPKIEDFLLQFGEQEPEELTEEDMANREAMLMESLKAAVGEKGTWQ